MADRSKDPTLKMTQVSSPTPPGMQTIDQPLSSLRRRHQRRRGLGRGGLRGFALWGLIGLVGLVIVAAIAAPLVYRSLRPEYRERIKHYAPFMSVFDPQREYSANSLPTVAPAEGGGPSAADLLLTPDVIVPAAALAGQDATPYTR